MSFIEVKKAKSFDIEIDSIASDKSISHRCAIFSLLSDKSSTISERSIDPKKGRAAIVAVCDIVGAEVGSVVGGTGGTVACLGLGTVTGYAAGKFCGGVMGSIAAKGILGLWDSYCDLFD